MIQAFVDRFMAAKERVKDEFRKDASWSYKELVLLVVDVITSDDEYETPPPPDPARVTVIDDGDYQGTQLFIIGAKGYQPTDYYAVYVSYGSCSGCDALEAVLSYDDKLSEDQIDQLWVMCLHIVQQIKEI